MKFSTLLPWLKKPRALHCQRQLFLGVVGIVISQKLLSQRAIQVCDRIHFNSLWHVVGPPIHNETRMTVFFNKPISVVDILNQFKDDPVISQSSTGSRFMIIFDSKRDGLVARSEKPPTQAVDGNCGIISASDCLGKRNVLQSMDRTRVLLQNVGNGPVIGRQL